jgi:hypothetical protein
MYLSQATHSPPASGIWEIVVDALGAGLIGLALLAVWTEDSLAGAALPVEGDQVVVVLTEAEGGVGGLRLEVLFGIALQTF